MKTKLRGLQRKFIKEFKYALYVVKNDPQVLTRIRTLALAYMVIATVIYGTYNILVSPGEKKQNKAQKAYKELENTNPISASTLLTEALIKLKKEDEALRKKISLRQFQQNLKREEARSFGGEQQFAKTVLALSPGAPKLLKHGQGSMTSLPPEKGDGYTIYRVTIEGENNYNTLINYLQFLENRPEIGELDKMEIDNLHRDQPGETPLLKYSIRVGRIAIDDG